MRTFYTPSTPPRLSFAVVSALSDFGGRRFVEQQDDHRDDAMLWWSLKRIVMECVAEAM
jgi:hypothetical protein